MKKILFATVLLLGSTFLSCQKKDHIPEVIEPSFLVQTPKNTVEENESVVFRFSSVDAEIITFFSGESGSRYGKDAGTIIKTPDERLELFSYTYEKVGVYKATFVASNQDERTTKELEIVVTEPIPEPPHPEIADFKITWPLTTDNMPTKSDIGAIDVTAHDMYAGLAYRNQQFTTNGFLFSEGITAASGYPTGGGFWVGRFSGSHPNDNFTAPIRTSASPSQPQDFETTDMYVEFSLTADQSRDLKISNISIPLARVFATTAGGLHYNIAYSLDGFSGDDASINYISGTNSSAVTLSESEGTFTYAQDIIVPKGTTLAVRLMVWRRNNANISGSSAVQVKIENVKISGTSYKDLL